MSRYFDDELSHSGVKGMRWRKHKYRLVKDANGKLRYVYDNTGIGVKNSKAQSSKAQMFRQARAEKKDKAVGKRSNTGTKSLTETYLVSTKTTKNGPLQTSKLRSTVLTGRSGEQKQREEKLEATRDRKAIERMARSKRIRQAEANKEQIESRANDRKAIERMARRIRIRQAEANEKQVERRKRIRQAEANKEQVERRKMKAQHVANNQKAKATGKRASWASDKPYQSKVEYDQAHQSFMLKERNKLRKKGEPSLISSPYNGSASKYHDEFYKDQQRNAKRSMEGFESGLSERHNSPSLAGPGHRARAAESTARHKDAVNDQRRKRIRQSEANKEQVERRKRIRQAEANKKQIEKRKADEKARKIANDYIAKTLARYNAAVKAQKKKKFTDTIDKGRKAVEEFFTPKKKKKR